MTIPILTTKLYIPKSRSGLIARPRLIEQLNAGLRLKLTLISAPAGFGKSTLTSAWVSKIKNTQVAWISLDDGDNDLARFLHYFVAALQTVLPDFGTTIFASLQSLEVANHEIILTNLINELAQAADEIILVLDDYHVIETPAIDQALTFLLEHLPAQIHLVIASRIDPSFPLSRMRARGDVLEIRANDLRFTVVEATDFLNQVMGFKLSEQAVIALCKRTEGWIAGLQLAALSMQGINDSRGVSDFVQRFTGSDRYIQDYLVDEVLGQQPPELQVFLLKTAVLERLSGPLCDRVRFGPDEPHSIPSQQILENLEAANLFIIPLDNERRWYRYHHLFADLLRHRLQQTYPDHIQKLHYWASDWFQRADYFEEAIWHAQAANDHDKLADIIEECWYVFVHRGEMKKLIQLLDLLGQEYTQRSAPLSMAYAWVYYLEENIEPIPTYLENIRQLMANGSIPDEFWKQTEFAVIPSLMETLEASQYLASQNLEDAKKHATQAISLIPEDPDPRFPRLLKAAATYKLAQIHLKMGEIDPACNLLLDVLELLKTSGDHFGAGNILILIVDVYQVLDKTQAAIALCEDTLQYFIETFGENIPAYGMINLILADLQANGGDLAAARKNLEVGKRLTAPITAPQVANLLSKVETKLEKAPPKSQALAEPLTIRELEVLTLIAQGLTNREIGEQLYLALDTVKGHNRNIFGKLGVRKRLEAVTKARELGLLK
jgi:LuxR family maltose regulon positive regulatory protein